MKAVISGAGIAGLTLAVFLGQRGWEVTVLDEGPSARGEGYMIDLFGSGYEAARRMGLMPRLEKLRYVFQSIRWLNAAGRTTARLPFRTLEGLFEGRLMHLMRSDLERALLEQLPPNVTIRYGVPVTQVRTPVGCVDAYLGNGDVEHADVLIGADGIRSRIRDLTFGDGGSWLRFLGFQTAAFVIHDAELNAELKNDLHLMSAPGRQAGLYPLRDGDVAAFFVHRAASGVPPSSPLAALEKAYGQFRWQLPRVLERARALPGFLYENVAQVVVPHWYRGRIALLGEACQAVSLLPGQGAALSMAAAYVLGEELTHNQDVKVALDHYERRVRPPLAQMRRAGRRSAEWLVPATAAGIVARDAAIRLARIRGLSRLLRPAISVAREDVLVPVT
ncbi:MAG TPA: FAD-dependent monooxygenase [Steroidobacteraceae bacterium]|jgi:2-polyprenyl-6-methoxyphenol hydroxylase-like FAD-dependent oxidoreductase|nr:FAD-dependent monooxygenase [Steroidobacteraceae bacterium]